MNNVELYLTNSTLQKKGAISYLEEVAPKIRWKHSNNRVLDIGCGDGSTTALLRKIIPTSYKLFGCDINEEMVNHANDHHSDENTSFFVLDIEGYIPPGIIGKFDYVFSFYALHWVRNQERAFVNIYNQLKKDGKCFIIMVGYSPNFDVYRKLIKSRKWSEYMPDIEKYISPYHDAQNPAKDLRTIMENIGFVDIEVECRNMTFLYESIPALTKSMRALVPFNIPKERFDDFMKDYIQVMRELKVIERNSKTNEEEIRFKYCLIVAHARKSNLIS